MDVEPVPWEPRVSSPDVDYGLVVWAGPDGPRGRLDLDVGAPPATEVVERLLAFVEAELAGEGLFGDTLRERRARDVVLSIGAHGEHHSLGHGTLDAPGDHPLASVRDLMVAARELLGG